MFIILDFSVFSPFLVVGTSATVCLQRLVSEMTYSVSSGTLNSATSNLHVQNTAEYADTTDDELKIYE